jgi:hypothetical protein
VVELEDEIFGPLFAIFQTPILYLPIVSHLLFQALLTESLHGDQLLAPYPFSVLEACQPFTFPGFVYKSSCGEQLLVTPPFSGAEACLLSTFAGFVY